MRWYSGTCLKQPPLGPKLLAALDRWSYYAGSILNVKGSYVLCSLGAWAFTINICWFGCLVTWYHWAYDTVEPILVTTCIRQPPPYCGHFLNNNNDITACSQVDALDIIPIKQSKSGNFRIMKKFRKNGPIPW